MKVAKSAGWWLPYENVCFVSERHNEVHKDDQGRLHHPSKMAVSYPDGFGVFSIHGVNIPTEKGFIVTNPETGVA